MDRIFYRDAYLREAAALTAAARQDLKAPIPSCPGWSTATLIAHMIEMNIQRITLVARRPEEFHITSSTDLDLPPQFNDWFDHPEQDPAKAPEGLLDLYERTTSELGNVLWALDPAEPMYTWWRPDQSAGFWQRRMAIETAIHRWDAQLAQGTPQPVEAELACDGINENFEIMLAVRRHWADQPRQGQNEVYHFHRTDGPGEWLVRFAPEGPIVTHEHAKGDSAVRGSADDLFLFLWQRIPAERLEVFGDPTLISRYFELVPPD